jgi:hypothetical protein
VNGGDEGVVLGKLVTFNFTPNFADAAIYGDDRLAEKDSGFIDGSATLETDDLTPVNFALLYGATKGVDGAVTSSVGDAPPEGCFGFYKRGLLNNTQYFEGYFYPRVQAQRGAENSQTKGQTTNFQTSSATLTIMANDSGEWETRKQFTTEADVREWIDGLCSIETVA